MVTDATFSSLITLLGPKVGPKNDGHRAAGGFSFFALVRIVRLKEVEADKTNRFTSVIGGGTIFYNSSTNKKETPKDLLTTYSPEADHFGLAAEFGTSTVLRGGIPLLLLLRACA